MSTIDGGHYQTLGHTVRAGKSDGYFMAYRSVVAFDVSILLQFAWLDVFQPYPAS